jgi:hypothetical protein
MPSPASPPTPPASPPFLGECRQGSSYYCVGVGGCGWVWVGGWVDGCVCRLQVLEAGGGGEREREKEREREILNTLTTF